MLRVTYTILDGRFPITAKLIGSGVADNVHYSYGQFTFENVPDGNYTLKILDGSGHPDCYQEFSAGLDPFIFEVTFANPNTTINLPLGAVGDAPLQYYNFYVDWGDGSELELVDSSTSVNKYHTYSNSGSYDITINGKCQYFGTVDENVWAIGTTQIRPYITKVKRWGNIQIENISFWGCLNLTTLPSGAITGVLPTADIGYCTFRGCNSLLEIPAGLFDNCIGSTWFLWTFEDCWSLTSIPEGLFDNCPEVEFFGHTFSNCYEISSSIPTGFFDYNPNVLWFVGTFRNCYKLSGSIPTGLFDNNTLAQTFDSVFYGCESLSGSIPTGLFDNCPSVQSTIKGDSFNYTFYGCDSLSGSIPDYLFVNNTLATSFISTFSYCTSLTGSIPSTLFTTNTLTTNFSYALSYCSGITGAIPSNLFTTNTLATDFSGVFRQTSVTYFSGGMFDTNTLAINMNAVFYGCHHIVQSIPSELFKYNTEVNNFSSIFNGCYGLTGSIPSDLFSYAPDLKNVSLALAGCSGLTGSIPANLLTNNPLIDIDGNFGIRHLFNGCSGLTGAIPSGLFANQTHVITFQGVFTGCYGLTSIPSGLFDTNINVGNGTSIGFDGTFEDCYSITSMPTLLFANNTYATNFSRTFYGCSSLQLNRNIFCSDADITTRFLNKSPNFSQTFYRTLWSGTQGEAPFLWNFSYGTGAPQNTSECFSGTGNKVESLSNYCNIPLAWGAPGCTSSLSETHTANVAVSSGSWVNFASLGTRLRADDNVYVTTTSTTYTDGVMRDFGYELPTDAIITGIQVLVQWKTDYTFAADFIKVNLSLDGINWGTESAEQYTTNSSETLKTFGSVDSLWGLSPTASNINDPNFSLKLSGKINSPYSISVEYVHVKVYYTAPISIFTPIKYGLTYNEYAYKDARNIAASGWKIAEEADFATLRNYLQGTTTDWNSNTVSGVIKSPGNIYFDSPNTGATNSYKLSLRGAGYANSAGWTYSFRSAAYYWCNTYGYPTTNRYCIYAFYNSTLLGRTFQTANYGASIRLIKLDSTDPGSYTGNDGKVYPVVKIGNQVWLATNLAETKYRNGDDIPRGLAGGSFSTYGSSLTGCYCYPNDDINNV